MTQDAATELRRSEGRYRSLVLAAALDVWRAAPDGRLLDDMPGWRRVTGQRGEDVVGTGWLSGVHPDHRARVAQTWERAVRTGERYECEYPILAHDGTERIILARAIPLVEDGVVIEWIGASDDVTEQRRAMEQLREETHTVEMLHEIGSNLTSSLDMQTLVQALTDATTKLTGAEFGAFFYTSLTEAGERFLLYTLSGAPREAFARFGVPRNTAVFAPTFAGEAPVRLDDVTKDPRYGRNAPHRGMPEGHLPVRSYLAVPVVSRTGVVHGGLFFGHHQPGVFTARHEQLVVGIAAQAAVAMDNAQLYEAERAARASAEQARRRLELLASAGPALGTSLDVGETAQRLADVLVPAMAQWCLVQVQRDGRPHVAGSAAADDDEAQATLEDLLAVGVLDHGALLSTDDGVATSRQLVDVGLDVLAPPGSDGAQLLREHAPLGLLVVPLRAGCGPLGSLVLGRSGAAWSDDERTLVEELAARAGLALDIAVRYARERSTALTLQRSLLPQTLPVLPATRCATRYLPGASGSEVGGDWYDAVMTEDGGLTCVVGDVMGRGVTAAAVMGQLRATLRAYALDEHGPAEVLRRADRAVRVAADEPRLTTCVVARVDPARAQLRLASAGHLPPLVLDRDGQAQFVELPPGLPLGVGGADFDEVSMDLAHVASVLLYTDGLVERPDRGLDEGLERLRTCASLAARRGAGPEELADEVLRALGADEASDDDVALLVLELDCEGRAEAQRRELDLEGQPRPARTARAFVVGSARELGLEPVADTLELLVGELVTNADRYGGGAARLRLERDEQRVRVEVVDHAPQQSPAPRQAAALAMTEGGRGLHLVEALAQGWGSDPGTESKTVWFSLDVG